jgi:hypothetical protein
MERHQAETRERRWKGIHAHLRNTMRDLKKAGAFFAVSLTVTRSNFDVVTHSDFVRETIDAGCRFFLLLEYTPVAADTERWVIADEQGGCLAAGRGFVHISPTGALEPPGAGPSAAPSGAGCREGGTGSGPEGPAPRHRRLGERRYGAPDRADRAQVG